MATIAYVVYGDGIPQRDATARLLAEHMPPTLPPSHAMVIDAPMPGAPESDMAQEAAWPGWRKAWPALRGHVIVTCLHGGKDFEAQCDAAESVLRAASILARHTPAVAVGWSANLLYHPAQSFIASVERGMPAVDVLVRCHWRGHGPATGARTEGLAAFGLPEFDHEPTGEGPDEIYNRIMNLSHYVLQDGKVLGDGDTIGTTRHAQLRVHHGRDTASGSLLLTLREA